METSIQTFIDICQWDPARFFIFSGNVFGILIYYSHLTALILSLFIGIFILFRDKKSLLNQLLFLITFLFSLWTFFDLFLWANEKPNLQMFVWSAMVLIEPLIYALCLYFVDVFINKKDVSFKKKLWIFLPLLPIIILLPTKFVLQGFDLTNCYRDITEGFVSVYYVYLIEIFYAFWILIFLFREHWKAKMEMKKPILFIGTGIIMFLISFVSGNIVGSLTDNWILAQIGLFGMPIFIAFLAYMIVNFKTFNIKLIGTQVLVFTLGLLIFFILFIRKIEDVRIVVIFTLLFVLALGYALIKSVKKEVEQKEELGKLNIDMETLLKQRESLTHLITHKVKSSFTHSKYIFSGMVDGTFGEISPELKKWAEKGLESDDIGINTVDLILNASNIQKGLIKYEMKKINLKDIVLKVFSEKKVPVEKRGLKIKKDIKPARNASGIADAGGKDDYPVFGDAFWLKEAINNVVENSLKYTKRGEIVIGLEKKPASSAEEKAKIIFSVKDTGIGITEEDKKNLFTEGGRGKDSVKTNVDSTGYGLFTVKLVIEAHQGRVWADSEGENKGSQFYIELPIAS